MKLITYQPNSLPPGRYAVTLDSSGAMATAVYYRNSVPPIPPAVCDADATVILIDGPDDLAAAILGKNLEVTIQTKKKHPTIAELLKI